MVMGHSLGEYGALVAAGALSFAAALEAVSARGREMASLDIADNGAMAAVFAPLGEIERIVATADGYVVVANVNSHAPGGHRRRDRGGRAGHRGVHRGRVHGRAHPGQPRVPHVDRRAGQRAAAAACAGSSCGRRQLPIVANVDGEFYPARGRRDGPMLDILGAPGRLAGPVRQGPADAVRGRGAGSSSRSGRRRHCTASSRTCSGGRTTTSSRCSPTTPSTATSRRSTRRCAVCTPPASAIRRGAAPSSSAERPCTVPADAPVTSA